MSLARIQKQRKIVELPLAMHWKDPQHPLPVRIIRSAGKKRAILRSGETPAWIRSGEHGKPFHFCDHIRRLAADAVSLCEPLGHIETRRILFAVTQARNGHTHGLQARVTPMRFPDGKTAVCRRGIIYQIQRYFHNETEFLYLITFCLPRFLNQDFDSKLVTLFHELYHISPAFDGDLRRHKGRYALHTHSQRDYDKLMANLARDYLSQKPDRALYDFLRLDFSQLEKRHGSILGTVVPRPKIIPTGLRRSEKSE